MTNMWRRGTRAARGAVLVVGCWLPAMLLAAQSSPSGSIPRRLDSKTASKLMLRQVRPEYPTLAKLNYIQGPVRMQVTVTREGRVGEAHVVEGHPFLAASALKAVRRWLYRPFQTGSGPTAFQTLVEVNFTLRTKKLRAVPSEPQQDLERQVRPPEVLEGTVATPTDTSVRLRVLVSEKGLALDTYPLAGPPSHHDRAQRIVERWTFRPARWGALAVPWYMDVNVPVEAWQPGGGATGPRGG